MKIAQVAPLYESVPPKYYGGTERVVSYLTEELVKQGHEVTLFASGDSNTSAELIPICSRSLRLDDSSTDPLAHHVLMLQRVSEKARRFDVIHFHTDYLHFPLTRMGKWPSVTTLHGRLDISDLSPLYDEFQDMPVVSISDAQRAPLPQANWHGTVYHGLPGELYEFQADPNDYVAFIGRLSPEKRADRAIEVTRRAGVPLKIAAKVDAVDQEYFDVVIKPLLKEPHVEYIGEIGDLDKGAFLGNARALIFPIDWPEPFGLVMIEALACGTPVIAYDRGSVSEVIDNEQTGFIVNSIEEATKAIENIPSLDRSACRRTFEERFSTARMAKRYVAVYEKLTAEHKRDEAP